MNTKNLFDPSITNYTINGTTFTFDQVTGPLAWLSMLTPEQRNVIFKLSAEGSLQTTYNAIDNYIRPDEVFGSHPVAAILSEPAIFASALDKSNRLKMIFGILNRLMDIIKYLGDLSKDGKFDWDAFLKLIVGDNTVLIDWIKDKLGIGKDGKPVTPPVDVNAIGILKESTASLPVTTATGNYTMPLAIVELLVLLGSTSETLQALSLYPMATASISGLTGDLDMLQQHDSAEDLLRQVGYDLACGDMFDELSVLSHAYSIGDKQSRIEKKENRQAKREERKAKESTVKKIANKLDDALEWVDAKLDAHPLLKGVLLSLPFAKWGVTAASVGGKIDDIIKAMHQKKWGALLALLWNILGDIPMLGKAPEMISFIDKIDKKGKFKFSKTEFGKKILDGLANLDAGTSIADFLKSLVNTADGLTGKDVVSPDKMTGKDTYLPVTKKGTGLLSNDNTINTLDIFSKVLQDKIPGLDKKLEKLGKKGRHPILLNIKDSDLTPLASQLKKSTYGNRMAAKFRQALFSAAKGDISYANLLNSH